MELVYLWVEEYKNIYHQGFNFSPRFDCKYDEEKNELTIDENKEYVSIFPENINITAIVGENGSGKSTIFELISLLRLEYAQLLRNTNILILFENNDILYPIIDINYHEFKCLQTTQIINHSKFYPYAKKSVFSNYLFNITMFTGALADFTYQNNIVSNIRKNDKYDNFYNGLSLNYTNLTEENKILEQSLKYTKIMQQNSNIFDFLGMSFLFDNFHFEIDLNSNLTYTFDKKYIDKIEDYTMKFNGFDIYNIGNYYDKFDENRKIKKKYENKIKENSFYRFASYYYIETLIKAYTHFKRDLNSMIDEQILKFIEELNNFTKKVETAKKKENLKSEETDLLKYFTSISLCNKYFDSLKEILKNYYKYVEKTEKKKQVYQLEKELTYYKKKLNIFKHINLIYKIFKKNFYLKDYEHEQYTFISKSRLIQDEKIRKIRKQISKNDFINEMYWSSVLKINFINGNSPHYNYNLLSSGEKQVFDFIINFIYTFFCLDKESLEKMVIFLDEIDVGFHPNWQKQLISYIVKLINKIENLRTDVNIKFHLIFTTHSPFLLSDIPKDHIVFLKYGKQDNPNIEQTFGANIHTLLSHGFFMKDGLMGEFAKNKISKILKFLSEENKFIDLEVKILPPLKIQNNFFEKNLKPIIEFIGEDFLKEKLLKMYEIKFPKSNEAKIKELENEIKRLKNASN
ncbi:AAA family ATPase [Malaciobacter canalis]|uniref:AAA family ATPase n=1 Tax=Malaciobacter canalis TaxID=1912871 RepID=UPI00384E7093